MRGSHLSTFLLLLSAIDANNINNSSPQPQEHSGQHVTTQLSMSMANIKDNKTFVGENKTDPISISISPTWSSTHSPSSSPMSPIPRTRHHSSPTSKNSSSSSSSSSSLAVFGSMVTKKLSTTPSQPPQLGTKQKTVYFHHQQTKKKESLEFGESINVQVERRSLFSSRETIAAATDVKRSTDEFEFQLEPPLSLASSSSSRNTGPYFESNKTTMTVTSRAGQTVLFDCAVVLLQGRTVSWLRRRQDNLQLLTVGNASYYSDSRVGLRFRYPNNWRLGIESVRKSDEGQYVCQLSTHPPKALIINLKVIAPQIQILDENGHVVTERHYKVDSSLHLTCKASHVDKAADNIIWMKGDRTLPGGDSRIKVKLTKSGDAATGYLSIVSMSKKDDGNFTCKIPLASSTIAVHVLNGELPAAVSTNHAVQPNSIGLFPLLCLSLLISKLLRSSSVTLHTGYQHFLS